MLLSALRAVQLSFYCKRVATGYTEESSIDVRSIYQKVKQCLALNFDMEEAVHLKQINGTHRKNKLDRQHTEAVAKMAEGNISCYALRT
jgi:hypothetical protein